MLELNTNNSWESANFVNYLGNIIDNNTEKIYANLASALNFALAKGWVNGKFSLHVHLRVRLVGEPESDNLCFLFQRKDSCADALFKQDSFGTPTNRLTNSIMADEHSRRIQGSVLIHVGKTPKSRENTTTNRNAFVRLRVLDDCPRVPIDYYPIKNTELFFRLSELDFIKKSFFAFINRKLVPPIWFMTVSKDKLPHEMVEGAPEIMDDVSSNNSEPNIGLWERLDHYNVPRVITPYITNTEIGLQFAPDVPFRYESAMVLFGPSELGSDSGEVSNP